jgi:hypothetical protein
LACVEKVVFVSGVEVRVEGTRLHTCRIKELGCTFSISLKLAVIHHAGLFNIPMALVGGVSPWCSNYQPETLNGINNIPFALSSE